MFQQGLDDVFASDALYSAPPHPNASVMLQGANYPMQTSAASLVGPTQLLISRPQSPLGHLSVSRVEQDGYPDDRWPMEWKAKPVSLATLPSFGKLGDDQKLPSFYRLPSIDQTHVSTLIELLGAPLEKIAWPAVDLSAFPSGLKIDHCIDRYFACFDKVICSRNASGQDVTDLR